MSTKTTINYACPYCRHANVWPLNKKATLPCASCGHMFCQWSNDVILDQGYAAEKYFDYTTKKYEYFPNAKKPALPTHVTAVSAPIPAVRSEYESGLMRPVELSASQISVEINESQSFPELYTEVESEAKNEDVPNRRNPHSLRSALSQLDSMVGLDSVKVQVRELTQLCLVQQARAARGLATPTISKHLVFTGNPGTGKTTVARIVSEIYFQIGLVKSPKVIETDRSGLVAAYIGQTAIKTQEKIAEAMGGVLFIDEAYTLLGEALDFGKEAIDTLLKMMEDHREDLCVIVAGYPNKMSSFIKSNPGLESRFNTYIHFDDYSASELNTILKKLASDSDYEIEPDATLLLYDFFSNQATRRPEHFANGRFARNIFENLIKAQALRIGKELEWAHSLNLRAITVGDVKRVLSI